MTEPTSDYPAMATVYGYPRQGPNRQLKKIVESYWAGHSSAQSLLDATAQLRGDRLEALRSAGVGEIPSNDFSLYDQVLDTAWMLGAMVERASRGVTRPAWPPALSAMFLRQKWGVRATSGRM